MKTIVYGIVALCGLAFWSCDGKNQLADKVTGEWSTPDGVLHGVNAIETRVIETYSFVRDSSRAGGTLIVSGMTETTVAPVFDNNVVQTVSEGIAANSYIEGTWTVVDDDEISINFDYSTLAVNVDTATVALRQNLLTGNEGPEMSQVSGNVAKTVGAELKSALQSRYQSMRLIDDVKVKGDVLKFEAGPRDFVLQRVIN